MRLVTAAPSNVGPMGEQRAMTTPAFQGITEAANGIVAAALDGFSVSENGGQPLLDAIQDLKTEVESALRKSSWLASEPPLGSTPNAEIYKPFLATIASDPAQGAVPMFRQLLDDLNKAEAAIKQAMANYRDADVSAGADITAAGLQE
jgi:hypothetical protein